MAVADLQLVRAVLVRLGVVHQAVEDGVVVAAGLEDVAVVVTFAALT